MATYPDWTTTQLRAQLRNTADDLGTAGEDNLYGYGLVDADEAAASVGNLMPVANAGSDQTVTDLDSNGVEAVTLDASASYDPDGNITAYEWSESGTALSTEVSFEYSFAVGSHNVIPTVTDNEGAIDTDTITITVNEPSASISVASRRVSALSELRAGDNAEMAGVPSRRRASCSSGTAPVGASMSVVARTGATWTAPI